MIWKAFRLGSDYEQNILYERIKLSKNKHTFFKREKSQNLNYMVKRIHTGNFIS